MAWFKDIAQNTIYQIIARIVSSGTTFLITIIVARHFGIAGYGDFAKVTAFVTLFYLIADFGLNAIFLQREDSHVHFHDLFYPRVALSCFLIFVVNALAFLLPFDQATNIGFSPAVRFGIFIYSFTILTESILISSAAIFQRELSYENYMISSIIGSIVSLLLIGIFTTISYTLFYVYIAFLLGGVVECATALILTNENLLPVRLDVGFIKKLTLETVPITLMLFFNLVYFRIDIILLSFMRSSHDIAIYDISYKVFDFLIALPLFLSNSLYPTILEHEKNNRTGGVAKRYIFLFIAVSFLVVIPVWFLAPLLSIVKKEFLEAVTPIRILLLSLPVFFGTNILQWLLIAQKQQRFLAYIYFLSTILNIGLNVFFIPQYGYVASAIITGVSELFVFIGLWIKVFHFKKNNA